MNDDPRTVNQNFKKYEVFGVTKNESNYFVVFKGREPLNEELDITQFEEISEVFIPELPEEVVRSYVDTGESM